MEREPSAIVVVLALVFLALHLPYLPASLEDLDSVNFALGIRDFDVARHQPHPPGYPVFIADREGRRAPSVPSEATALALVSVVAGALGVLAMAALFRRLDGARAADWSTAAVARGHDRAAVLVHRGQAAQRRRRPRRRARGPGDDARRQERCARSPSPPSARGSPRPAVAGAWLTVPLLIVKLLVLAAVASRQLASREPQLAASAGQSR